jgi:hypothetical protein
MSYHTIDKQANNVYVNIVITNNPTNGPSPPTIPNNFSLIEAMYSVTNTLEILRKASDWFASIIRFVVPAGTVPLFIMPIVPNQSNPNLTPMVIGITVSGTDYPVNVIYVPSNPTIPAPVQNLTYQVVSQYYYVYAYQNLIDAFNTALATAYTHAGSPGGAGAPYFFYTSSTQLISLVLPTAFVAAVGTPQVYINSYSRIYLDAFNFQSIGINTPTGKDNIFITNDLNQNNTAPNPPFTISSYILTQEYVYINSWSSLRKIVVTSLSLPVRSEYIPSQQGNGNLGQDVSATLPIVTDFVPNLEFAGQERSNFYYYPQSQYRIIDMLSDTPLTKIDLSFYWEDKVGNLYPILIPSGQQVSAKIAFVKKSLYGSPGNQLLLK